MPPNDGSSNRPLWTEEFSVHASEDAYVLRRQFTKFLVLTSLGMVAGNAWIWIKSLLAEEHPGHPEAVVARAADVPPGGVKLFTQRRVAIDAALLFVVLLLMVQMWLLTATLESYLAGHHDVALPGLLTSLVLFAACFGLYRLVVRLDRAPERAEERPAEGSGP